MTENFRPGDRVMIPNGECGTVLRVDGHLAHLELDSSLRKKVATTSLRKLENNDDSPTD